MRNIRMTLIVYALMKSNSLGDYYPRKIENVSKELIVCIMVFSTRVSREEHPTDEKHHQPYAFVDYVKAK